MTRYELNSAIADQAMVDKIETTIRSYLLMALSEARSMTAGMDPALRDKLMDDLAAHFHPDADLVRDLFTDGFFDAKHMAGELVEQAKDNMKVRA